MVFFPAGLWCSPLGFFVSVPPSVGFLVFVGLAYTRLVINSPTRSLDSSPLSQRM